LFRDQRSREGIGKGIKDKDSAAKGEPTRERIRATTRKIRRGREGKRTSTIRSRMI
jgi:hypothetical protein